MKEESKYASRQIGNTGRGKGNGERKAEGRRIRDGNGVPGKKK